jgi:hypothetical protein
MSHTELVLKSIQAKNALSSLYNNEKIQKDESKKDFKSFLNKAMKS